MFKIMIFISYIAPFFILVLIYYFNIFLPAKINNLSKVFLQKSLKVGDRVYTDGGIVGTVFQKKEDLIILSTFDGSLVEVMLNSVCKKF